MSGKRPYRVYCAFEVAADNPDEAYEQVQGLVPKLNASMEKRLPDPAPILFLGPKDVMYPKSGRVE